MRERIKAAILDTKGYGAVYCNKITGRRTHGL